MTSSYSSYYYSAILVPLYQVCVQLSVVSTLSSRPLGWASDWAKHMFSFTHELLVVVDRLVVPLGTYSQYYEYWSKSLVWALGGLCAENQLVEASSSQEVQRSLSASSLSRETVRAVHEAEQHECSKPEVSSPPETLCRVDDLPDELLSNVFLQCEFGKRARLAGVCRRWAHVLSGPAPWARLEIDTSRWSDAKEQLVHDWLRPRVGCVRQLSLGSSHYRVRICSPQLAALLRSALHNVADLDMRNVEEPLDAALLLRLRRLESARLEAADLRLPSLPSATGGSTSSSATPGTGVVGGAAPPSLSAAAAVSAAGLQQLPPPALTSLALLSDGGGGAQAGPAAAAAPPSFPPAYADFPAFVLSLRGLRELALALPAERWSLPDGLSALQRLSRIELARVRCLRLPSCLSGMRSLKAAALADAAELAGFGSLPRGLRSLRLEGVRWDGEVEAHLRKLTGLTSLEVERSGRAALLPPWLAELRGLQRLRLQETDLRAPPDPLPAAIAAPQQQQQGVAEQPPAAAAGTAAAGVEGAGVAAQPAAQQWAVEVELDALVPLTQLRWVSLEVAGEACRVSGCRMRLIAALPQLCHFELRCMGRSVRGADVLQRLKAEFGSRDGGGDGDEGSGGWRPSLELRSDSCGELQALLEVDQPPPATCPPASPPSPPQQQQLLVPPPAPASASSSGAA